MQALMHCGVTDPPAGCDVPVTDENRIESHSLAVRRFKFCFMLGTILASDLTFDICFTRSRTTRIALEAAGAPLPLLFVYRPLTPPIPTMVLRMLVPLLALSAPAVAPNQPTAVIENGPPGGPPEPGHTHAPHAPHAGVLLFLRSRR
jgi:hypothetical protein